MSDALNPSRWTRNSDVLLAAAVVGVLVVLIVPVPTFIIDVLLTLNIALSILLLIVALGSGNALDFSTFPSILLFTTLFRLALNVASTRLVLMDGYAGEVINAFGNFVVGGNMVIGLVVFLILVIIQFVVITKGAGRVSEVAARFTLDAMPGKQMAIDADLNAGLITEQEARARRQKIAQEAEFYGSMDGASKFVRGDAIAGIIITAVNLIGGIVMGKMRGMPLPDALKTYCILTVGDGLVTQIPSLIVAVTSGIIITKASSSKNLAQDMGRQVLSQPRSLLIAAAILALFGITPGLPMLPFFIMAGVLVVLYFASSRAAAESAAAEPQTEAAAAKPPDENAEIASLMRVDRLSIEVGYQLIPLLDPGQSDDMLRKIRAMRKQLAAKLGIIVPAVRVHDNLQLKPNEYVIRLRGAEIARGTLLVDHLLAIDSGMVIRPIQGEATREPAFGLPALWIGPALKEQAEGAGYTVAEPRSVMLTHLSEVVRKSAHEILSRDDVKQLVEHAKEHCPAVVEELIPNTLPLGVVQKVLQNLLAEGIPITDMPGILEAVADHAATTKDPVVLTEHVRKSIARHICTRLEERGSIGAITLDPAVERMIATALQETGGVGLALEPGRSEQLARNILQAVRETVSGGFEAVLLTSSPIRRHVRRLVQQVIPELPVLAYDELVPGMKLEGRATVALDG